MKRKDDIYFVLPLDMPLIQANITVMNEKNIGLALLLSMGISMPALAQRDATPEYSGPSARQDRSFDTYQENRAVLRNNSLNDLNARAIRRNDTGVDRATQKRFDTVQQRMEQQRYEVRRRNEQQQIINRQKLND